MSPNKLHRNMDRSNFVSRRTALRHLAAGTFAVAASPMALGSLANASTRQRGENIKVALVGGAHIHAPGFAEQMAETDFVETKYVWDPDEETAAARREVTGGEIVNDPATIFQDPEVDGIVITSETVDHIDLVPPAVEAGKHLFVEKPVGMNGDEARRIAQLVNDAGVIFQTGYFMRSSGTNQKIRQLIQEGALGDITRLRLSNVHSGAIGGWFDDEWYWMTDLDQAGVGAFGDLGSHVMDLLLWFMSGDTPTSCTAYIDKVLERYPDCDEYGEGMLRFSSGAVATLAGGWVSHANPNQIEVSGTAGHLRVTNNELFVTIPDRGLDGSSPYTDVPDGWDHPLQLFFAAVGGANNVPLITADETALTNHAITRMYEAHEASTWLEL